MESFRETEVPKIRLKDRAEFLAAHPELVPLGKLAHSGFDAPRNVVDVMLKFAPIPGEWNNHYGDWKWQSLGRCADYYHAPDFEAHNSLGGAQATAWRYRKMLEEECAAE